MKSGVDAMFNENVKNEYLDQLISTSIKRSALSIFRNSEEYEEYFNKDICNFIEPEIKEYFASIGAISFVGLHSKCSVLRTYTQWCIDKKISKDNINHYDSITPAIIESCLNKVGEQSKYITFAELKELAKDFTNVSDSALCYCLYFGIYGKNGNEIINMTEDDIDVDSATVKLVTGREVRIPHEVISVLIDSCNEYDYILPTGKRFATLPLDETDRSVFKRRANARLNTEDSNNRRIINRLLKLKSETGYTSIGISRLKNSGLLEAIKKFSDANPQYRECLYDRKEVREIYKTWDMTFPPIKKTFYNKVDKYLDYFK